VVCKYRDREPGSLEFRALFFKTADNSEKFLIVYFVVTFSYGMLL
jgi:hypothetical protein